MFNRRELLKLSGQGILALGAFKMGCLPPSDTPEGLASIADVGTDLLVFGPDGSRYRIARARHEVQKLNPDGHIIWEISGLGDGHGELNFPTALEVGKDGRLLIVDTGNHRIEQYDADGNYVKSIGRGTASGETADEKHLDLPGSVVLGGDGLVYVCDTGQHQIQVLDPEGETVRSFGGQGTGLDELNSPRAIELDPEGHLHVIDRGNHRIQVFDTQGEQVRSYGSFGDGEGGLRVPTALLIDAQGNCYVADAADHALDVFGPDGEPVAIVELAFADGRPCSPWHLSWTAQGQIYVTGNPVELTPVEA